MGVPFRASFLSISLISIHESPLAARKSGKKATKNPIRYAVGRCPKSKSRSSRASVSHTGRLFVHPAIVTENGRLTRNYSADLWFFPLKFVVVVMVAGELLLSSPPGVPGSPPFVGICLP